MNQVARQHRFICEERQLETREHRALYYMHEPDGMGSRLCGVKASTKLITCSESDNTVSTGISSGEEPLGPLRSPLERSGPSQDIR
jgi:hypothetical protein